MKAAVDKHNSLHIYPASSGNYLKPMPVTFYLTEEILADEDITADHLADLLKGDVAFAVEFYRDKYRESVTHQ